MIDIKRTIAAHETSAKTIAWLKELIENDKAAVNANLVGKLQDALKPESTYWLNASVVAQTGDIDLLIFCRVIGEVEFMEQQDMDEDAPPNYYAECWDEQVRTGFVLTESFSAICPAGEYGDTHTTRLTLQLTQEAWEQARADGWNHKNKDGLSVTGKTMWTKLLSADWEGLYDSSYGE